MKLIIVIVVALLSFSCTDNRGQSAANEDRSLPQFRYRLLDGVSVIKSSDFKCDKPLVLFIFDPDCIYCKSQLRSMISEIDSFDSVNIYMVSYAPLNRIREYNREMNLSRFENILVGKDETGITISELQIQSIPFTGVYDKFHILKKRFYGAVTAEVILKSM